MNEQNQQQSLQNDNLDAASKVNTSRLAGLWVDAGEQKQVGGEQQGQQVGGEQQKVAGQQQQVEGPGLVGLTKEQIQEIVQGTAQAVSGQQPRQQQQYTIEDFNKAFNVVQVTPELLSGFGLRDATPEMAKAFEAITQAIVKQAVTMNAYQLEQVRQTMMGEFAPVIKFSAEAQAEQLKTEFFGVYPDLKGFDPLLIQVKDQLVSEGADFKGDKKAAFKAVAERTRAVIKSLPGLNGQQQGAGDSQHKETRQNAARMSTVSAGGQGGAGSGGGSAAGSNNTAKTIFG